MKKTGLLIFIIFLGISISGIAQPFSHDPSNMVKDGSRYWIYSTGNGISVVSSTTSSFGSYRYESAVFPGGTYPAWIKTYVSGFEGHFWAPEIFYMNNKWHLYYSCSTFGSQNSCIGLATTTSLGSNSWKDEGMVTFSNNTQNVNAIDADLFRDKEGKVWMLYGSYWSGLVITQIDTLTGKPINRNQLTYVANNGCEAGQVVYNDGYYYLMFNRGNCCKGINSTYEIFMGRSTSPTGPFLDQNGVNCNSGGGTSFLHSDGRFIGPGHFGLMENVLTYHFYDGLDRGNAKLRVASLKWENGWPVAVYTAQGNIKDGVYQLINKNSEKALALQNSATNDGTIAIQTTETGADAEKWRVTYLDNKYYRIEQVTAPGKVLEIFNCSNSGGANAGIWTQVGSACQEWYISLMPEGYYRVTNKNSRKVLEIVNAYTHDGANAIQWDFNEHATQQWKFKAAVYINAVNDLRNTPQLMNIASMDGFRKYEIEVDKTLLKPECKLKLMTISGQLIRVIPVNTDRIFIRADNNTAGGIYLLQLYVDNRIAETRKIILKN